MFSQSTRASRKKRDLSENKNVKTFEFSASWEITTNTNENFNN